MKTFVAIQDMYSKETGLRKYQKNGENYYHIERVESGHELIGEYVVVISGGLPKNRANRLCIWENEMVSKRGEDSDTFRVEKKGFDHYVTRKLCVGDQVEFIGQDMIGGE